MKKEFFSINGIPAALYGESSKSVYLFVHGKCGNKEEAEFFAETAAAKGWQVLGIDLPGHGERSSDMESFVPWRVVPELRSIMEHMRARWSNIALRANSIGAMFCMLAYPDEPLCKSLFVSPLLDMEKLIRGMMYLCNVSEEELRDKKIIPTSIGETLSWEYYEYAKANPISRWSCPTAILYAGGDSMTDRPTVDGFVKRFGCELTVMENGEHWFHTPEQLAVLSEWSEKSCGFAPSLS